MTTQLSIGKRFRIVESEKICADLWGLVGTIDEAMEHPETAYSRHRPTSYFLRFDTPARHGSFAGVWVTGWEVVPVYSWE